MKRGIHYIYIVFAAILLCSSCKTVSPEKKKYLKEFKKEQREIERIERKEVKRALKEHQKVKKEWVKLQAPEVQKKLKQDKKDTKKFYKKYGKAKTNVVPGKRPAKPRKYKKDGIKKR